MTHRRFPAVPAVRLCRALALALLVICVLVSVCRAGSPVDLDQDGGLPDARIGTPLKAFTGLKQIEDTGRWLSFVRPEDKLTFLDVSVSGITYNFFKERLYSINLEISGKGPTKKMLKTLQKRYGKETSFDSRTYLKVTSLMEIREWAGAKLYCVYKSSSEFDGGVLTLLDKATWDQLQVPKKEKEAQSRSLLKGSFTNGDF